MSKKDKKLRTKKWYETEKGTPSWESRLLAVSAYMGALVSVFAPVPIMLGIFVSKNQFLLRHAKQAFALQVATLVILAIFAVMDFGITELLGVEWYEEHIHIYTLVTSAILFLVVKLHAIVGAIMSLKGKPFVVPVYGKFWQTSKERREQRKAKEKGKYL